MSTAALYIPPEIVLAILSSPTLTPSDILKCTRVSKEWCSLVYGTNKLREKLFLSAKTASGGLEEVRDPTCTAKVRTIIVLDMGVVFQRRQNYRTHVRLYPLLQRYFVGEMYSSLDLKFSYRPLRELHDWRRKNSTLWADACIVSPPPDQLILTTRQTRCSGVRRMLSSTQKIENKNGVTIGDLFSATWSTRFKYNLGLVDNDGTCIGPSHPYSGEQESCSCYDVIGSDDQARAKPRAA